MHDTANLGVAPVQKLAFFLPNQDLPSLFTKVRAGDNQYGAHGPFHRTLGRYTSLRLHQVDTPTCQHSQQDEKNQAISYYLHFLLLI